MNRRLRFLVAGVAVLLVVALIAAAVAVEQRSDARDQARVADAARLVEQAGGQPAEEVSLSLLLALEARRLGPSDAADAAVQAALTRVPPGVERLMPAPGVRTGVPGVSPDGRLLAVPDGNGDIRLLELASGQHIRTLAGSSHGALNVILFSPDGRSVMGGSGDGVVRIWNVRTGKRRGAPLRAGDGTAWGVFDPTDATQALTVSAGQVVRWDVSAPARPARVGPTLALPHEPTDITILRTSEDGRRVAAGGFSNARTFVWDAESGSLIAELSGLPGPFTPDGSAIALLRGDRVEFVDVETGAVQGPTMTGFTNALAVAMSPDGRRVAVSDLIDSSVRVFDRESGEQLGPPLTYFGGLKYPVAFLNGERLLVAGTEEAVVWRYADADGPLTTLLDGGHVGVTFARFIPNASEVATAGTRDGQLLRWGVPDGRPLGALLDAPPGAAPVPRETVAINTGSFAFSGDGHTVALAHADGTVELWDRTTGRLLTSFTTGQGGGRVALDWSPSGPVLATTASADLSVVLWDVSDLRRPTVKARLRAGELPGDANYFPIFSPDGRILAIGNGVLIGQGTVTFIDAADGHVLREVRGLQNVADAAFSPDSKTLGVNGATLALIDVASGETIATRSNLVGSSVAFANRGKWLVTAGFPDEALPQSYFPRGGTAAAATTFSTTVQLWDAKSLQPVGEPITAPDQLVCCGRTNAHGTRLVTGEFVDPAAPDVDTAAFLWELDPTRWADLACAIAGRNLTRDEWADYLPGRDFRTTCAQWPANT